MIRALGPIGGIALLVLTLSSAQPLLAAQEKSAPALVAFVFDLHEGSPLPYINLIVRDMTAAVLTDSSGVARIWSAKPGAHQLQLMAVSFFDTTTVWMATGGSDTLRIPLRSKACLRRHLPFASQVLSAADEAESIAVFVLRPLGAPADSDDLVFRGRAVESACRRIDPSHLTTARQLLHEMNRETCCEQMDCLCEPRFMVRVWGSSKNLQLFIGNDCDCWLFFVNDYDRTNCQWAAHRWGKELKELLAVTCPDSLRKPW
jgi:hypothetical protein